MKRLVCIITAVLVVFISAYAAPTGIDYANDFADVLSPETERYINETGRAYQSTDGTQIVAVTIKSLEGASIEDYAYDLFNDWGIGDKNADNGILILLSVDDREIRVEVGDGLEGILNDAKVGRLIDSRAIPYFSSNDFDTGIKELYLGVAEVIGNPEAASEEETDAGEIVGSVILIILLIILSAFRGGRGGWRRGWGRYGGWGGYGGFGGFGGGSSGGGFGGFGGGGSSGGGASRRF